jgi:hypothetical protein
MKKIKFFLKQLLCKHNYEYDSTLRVYDFVYEREYVTHIYKCTKCNKKNLMELIAEIVLSK